MAFCITTLYLIGTFTPETQKSIKSQSKLTEICSSGNVHVTLIAFVKDTPNSNETNGIYDTFGQNLTSPSAEVSILNALKRIRSSKELYFQFKILN